MWKFAQNLCEIGFGDFQGAKHAFLLIKTNMNFDFWEILSNRLLKITKIDRLMF